MQDTDDILYKTDKFYRDLVDKVRANEKEQAKRQSACDQLRTELNLQYQKLLNYVNDQAQWNADMQNSFVRFWSALGNLSAQSQVTLEQQEQIRYAFHLAIKAAAHISKQKAPVASLVFDGLGIMTADNLLDAVKAAGSIINTVSNMTISDTESDREL